MNEEYLPEQKGNRQVDIVISSILAADCDKLSVETDEMRGFYHDRGHQLCLRRAVEHKTNIPLAYVFGTREHKYLDGLLKLLKPFSTGTVCTDNNCDYKDRIPDAELITGKKILRRLKGTI